VLVLVHSPLVVPLTWRAVAERFTRGGWPVVVPDLRAGLTGSGPYHPRLARLVHESTAAVARPGAQLVLVGHSGAGPLLPGIAATSPVPVWALVYVDAGLPHPGRTWSETAPAALVDKLRAMVVDGRLPPWHEWFPPEVLPRLLTDDGVRGAFTAEIGRLPQAYFEEPVPAATWSGPAGYLLLSEGYRDDATRAAGLRMPVVEHPSHHLAMAADPDGVTTALRGLLRALRSGPR
jgi:hypothetical protein